jgi:predicted nucleic acid-binding protein
MSEIVADTSALLYLYRIGALDWLQSLFDSTYVTTTVILELQNGQNRGYDVPDSTNYAWWQIVESQTVPTELMALELGVGETAVLAFALEKPGCVVLLDDGLARRTAQSLGLTVWGTLKLLLEAKSQGLIESITPFVDQLRDSGMWISDEIRQRVLDLANEDNE